MQILNIYRTYKHSKKYINVQRYNKYNTYNTHIQKIQNTQTRSHTYTKHTSMQTYKYTEHIEYTTDSAQTNTQHLRYIYNHTKYTKRTNIYKRTSIRKHRYTTYTITHRYNTYNYTNTQLYNTYKYASIQKY